MTLDHFPYRMSGLDTILSKLLFYSIIQFFYFYFYFFVLSKGGKNEDTTDRQRQKWVEIQAGKKQVKSSERLSEPWAKVKTFVSLFPGLLLNFSGLFLVFHLCKIFFYAMSTNESHVAFLLQVYFTIHTCKFLDLKLNSQ